MLPGAARSRQIGAGLAVAGVEKEWADGDFSELFGLYDLNSEFEVRTVLALKEDQAT